MPLESLEFRISLQRLLAGLILILLPLTLLGFFVALRGDNHVRQVNGDHFRAFAQASAQATSGYIAELVKDVAAIANNPTLVQAVTSSNRSYEHLNEEAVLSKIDAIENNWNSARADALSQSILISDLARQLRRERELNAKLLKITVVDVNGATVAATDRPLHYSQTDREYWRGLSSKGQDAIHVTDLRYDEQNRLYYLDITYPILQEGTGRFIGAVTALVDLSPMLAQLSGQHVGRTSRFFLVREDGTVVWGPGVAPTMKTRSKEYAAIQDVVGPLRSRGPGYVYATPSKGTSYLIGFADTRLREEYPNLPWIVLASQEESETMGVTRTMADMALLMLILALLIVSLLGAYVFLHRKQRLEDIESPPDNNGRPAAA